MHTIKNHPRIVVASIALVVALTFILMLPNFETTLTHLKRAGLYNFIMSHIWHQNLEEDYGDPLIKAAYESNPRQLNKLLAAGADPNGIREDSSPLFFAVRTYNPYNAKKLLEAGADPNGQIWSGGLRTSKTSLPLGSASTRGDIYMIDLLLDHGADINIHNGEAIESATGGGQWNAALHLLRRGANCGILTEGGNWRIGASAVNSRLLSTSEEGKARDKFIEILKKNGFPWPPPSPEETLKLIEEGKWPSCTVRE